jgi:hypothetical protein
MEHPGISIYIDFLAFWVDGGAWNALSCLCQANQVLNQGSPEIACFVNQEDKADTDKTLQLTVNEFKTLALSLLVESVGLYI